MYDNGYDEVTQVYSYNELTSFCEFQIFNL